MSIISNLVARFTADTTAFEQGTQRARKSLYDLTAESVKAQKSLGNLSSISKVFRLGMATYVIRSLTDTATGMLAARRHGDSMFEAFLAGIPIMNRLSEAADDLANELSGLAAVEETQKAWESFYSSLEKVRESLEKSLRLQQAGKGGEAAVKALFGYEDRLRDIDAINAQTEAIRKYNAEIDKEIDRLKKLQTAENVPYGQAGIMSWTLPTRKEIDEQIKELQSQKRILPNLDVLRSQAAREYSFEIEKITKETKNQVLEADKLIAKMQRENELLGMNATERAKAAAIDKFREAVQKDIAHGQQRAADLTAEEIAMVEKLAAEHFKLAEAAKKTERSAYDIAAAYVRMYQDIDSKTEASFAARERLLMEEYNLYKETIEDEAALTELLEEKQTELAIERAKETGSLLEGFGAGIEEMQRELQTIGELGAGLAQTFRDDFVGSLNDALWKSRELDESLKEMGITLAKMITQWLLMQAVTGAMGGIAGRLGIIPSPPPSFVPAVVGHKGARIGSITETRFVSPSIFKEAPRFHDLRPGERAVIANDDEVISRPGGFGNQNIAAKLDTLISIISQRQTINARIIDKRELVTKGQMEGRDGERWTMRHVQRNR